LRQSPELIDELVLGDVATVDEIVAEFEDTQLESQFSGTNCFPDWRRTRLGRAAAFRSGTFPNPGLLPVTNRQRRAVHCSLDFWHPPNITIVALPVKSPVLNRRM
jgi:hypothetical protein